MLLFLATVVEQLDNALEHLSKRDIHNARFGLMLTDNALELVLHQIAKDKESSIRMFRHSSESYPHQAALTKALGRNFDSKLKFAKIEAGLNEQTTQTIAILHGYRNEVYHVGIVHEDILPVLAAFYFDVACAFLKDFNPRGLWWGSGLRLPERAKPYFEGDRLFPGKLGDFGKACQTLRDAAAFDVDKVAAVLADKLESIVDHQNTCIDIVAGGVYEGQKTTRDKAILETQAWKLAFTDEGKEFAQSRKWTGNWLQLVEWLALTYPFPIRADPIPSWETQAKRLRALRDPHKALAAYHSFMSKTAAFREAIEQAAAAAEAEIDAAIDRMRGK